MFLNRRGSLRCSDTSSLPNTYTVFLTAALLGCDSRSLRSPFGVHSSVVSPVFAERSDSGTRPSPKKKPCVRGSPPHTPALPRQPRVSSDRRLPVLPRLFSQMYFVIASKSLTFSFPFLIQETFACPQVEKGVPCFLLEALWV